MIFSRKRWAWLCSASLWCCTAAWAEEPAAFPPAKEASNDLDVAKRFEQLQQRLDRLEAENGQLRQSMFQSQSSANNGVTPANAEMWNANADAACPPACQCPVCAAEKNGKGDWTTGWNHGIEWVSPDKAFKVHIGGRTQFDGIWLHAEGNALAGAAGAGAQDAVDFRRARLRADGTIYETIDYAAEYDFVNSFNVDPTITDPVLLEKNSINVPAPTDLWFSFREVPWVGNFRIGNHKEPFGFEHSISSRYLNFMERSFLQDLFAGPNNNGFTPGMSIFNTYLDERGTWAVGLYKNTNTDNVFARNVGDGEYAATGRLTFLPIDDKESHRLLHLGVAGSVRDPDNERIRFRTRSLRNGPPNFNTIYADTGTFNTNTQWLAGAELAGVFGSWSFQAEWMGSWCTDTSPIVGSTKGTPSETIFVNSYYAELHYFLTGEVRDYDRKSAAFGRVVPRRNFRWKDGCFQPGAWQVLFRYENADLNDKALQGGLLNQYTLGANWFLNPNMKIQFNYVCTERDFSLAGVDGGLIHGAGIRVAHDF